MVLAPTVQVASGPISDDLGTYLSLPGTPGSRGSDNDTDSEPNNEISSATNLTGNVSVPGTMAFEDPSDFYRVHLNNTTSPNRLNASLEFTSSDPSAMAHLAILDPYEFRLDQVLCDGSLVNASAVAIYEGWFYLGVLWDSQNSITASIIYTLNISLVDHVFTPDGNDHPSEAVVIADGTYLEEDLDDLTDVADFYTMHMDVGPDTVGVVLFMLEMDQTMDLAVEIYKGSDTFIRQINNGVEGGDELAYFIAPSSDDYYFRVWAYTGAGAYKLSVRAGAGWLDMDNDLGNATLVQEGITVRGNLTDDYDPDDFYSLNLTLGEEITVDLTILDYNATMAIPVLNVWLYNETSFVKNSTSSVDPVKEIWYEAEAAGWYYIRIGASDMSFGDYELVMTVVSPPEVLPHDATITIDEDQIGALDLSTIFDDPQGGDLVFDVSGNQSTSIVINGTNATISSMEPDWYGFEVVTFSAQSDIGKVAWTDMTIVFTPVNDAPRPLQEVLQLQDLFEDESRELAMSFLETKFADVDGDDLDFYFLDNENITILKANDTIVLTPGPNWNGLAVLTLFAEDPSGLNDSLQVNLTVLPVDDAPASTDMDIIDIIEDAALTVDLSLYFSDPDGDGLVFDGYSEGDAGAKIHIFVSINGSNATLTLAGDWYGEEMVAFTAKDPANNTASLTVLVRVAPINDAPVVNRATWDQYTYDTWIVEDTTKSFDLRALFMDVDKDTLKYKLHSTEEHLTAVINEHDLLVTPAKDWYGVEKVNLSAEDPSGLQVWTDLSITVYNDNDRPSLTNGSVSVKTGDENTKFKFSVLVSDIDGNEPIVTLVIGTKTYRMNKESGNVATGAVYTYTTKVEGGEHIYSFRVDDNQHTVKSEASLAGEKIVVEEPVDSSVYLYYVILALILVFLIVMMYAAWNRSQRMKEFDDSWDDDEEEEEDEDEEEEEDEEILEDDDE